ncbi:hypothetical protein NX059_005381 [Plenodomus lindquistii]|nr:hypothetical protein NX059_005381 [Plenodomus lindquistii]
MSEPRRSTRARAREDAAPPAPETPKETPTAVKGAKSTAVKRKRTSTAVKTPAPSTPAAHGTPLPPKQTLPLRLTEGAPLPTLPEPQPLDLPVSDWQSIQQSGVLAASFERSRAVWISGANFRTFHTFFNRPKKPADRTEEDKAKMQRQKELERNFPQIGLYVELEKPRDKDDKTSKPAADPELLRRYRPRLVVEPHTLPIKLFGAREAKTAPKKTAPPSAYGSWPNHSQHGQPNQYTQYNNGQPVYQPPKPRPPPPKPVQQHVVAPSAPTSAPAPDPVIHMLAARAGTDPELKAVMKIVAAGQASKEQLEFFQSHINELTGILAKQKAEAAKTPAIKAPPPAPKQLTAPPMPKQFPPPPAPKQISAPPPRPVQSTQQPMQPPIQLPMQPSTHQSAQQPTQQPTQQPVHQPTQPAQQTIQQPPPQRVQYQQPQQTAPKPYSPAPQQQHPHHQQQQHPQHMQHMQHMPPTPQPHPPYPPNYKQPQGYHPPQQMTPYHPVQPKTQPFRQLVFEFEEGNGDKFHFPSYSFLDDLPDGTGVKISFLITKMKPKPKTDLVVKPPATPAPKATSVSTPGPPPPDTPGAAPSDALTTTPNPNTPAPPPLQPAVSAPVTPYIPPPRIEDFDEKNDIADIDFYQPVTALLRTEDPILLESLRRAVRPPEVVEKYMNEVFDKCRRADETYLAFRLPKDGEEMPEKRARSGDATPTVATPAQETFAGGMGFGMGSAIDRKKAGRPRKSVA